MGYNLGQSLHEEEYQGYQAPDHTVIGSSIGAPHPMSRSHFEIARDQGRNSIGKWKLGGRDAISKPMSCVLPLIKNSYINDPVCQDDFYTNDGYFEGVVQDYYDVYLPQPTLAEKVLVTQETTVAEAAGQVAQTTADKAKETAQQTVDRAFKSKYIWYAAGALLTLVVVNKVVDEVL